MRFKFKHTVRHDITQAIKHTLPEVEILGFCMTCRYGWMMGNLNANTKPQSKQLLDSKHI